MCGISGIVGLKDRRESYLRVLPSMTQALKHRGPDDEGWVFFSQNKILKVAGEDAPKEIHELKEKYAPNGSLADLDNEFSIALGHRRLSIQDVSLLGHQPFCTDDENYWITYNGEIYNFHELRDELSSKGYGFKTNTDTEVLLNAYLEWGEECVRHFNGMWAFVIYDRADNILFGSRDRFGVKPFYYILNDDLFAFASEYKALLKIPTLEKKLNPVAVYDYLVLGKTELEEEGLVKDIFELMPAHSFRFDLNNSTLKKWKYYSLEFNAKWQQFNRHTFSKYSQDVRELIINAIRLRLRSDVSVGSCLSGGLDSSTIVCVINHLLSQEPIKQVGDVQKVFTACYSDCKEDERSWAKIVVDNTQTSWHQTFPKPEELINELEDLVYTQDIPFFSSSTYAQYKVMQLAHNNGIKVTLDGQGSDELFAGYSPQFTSFIAEAFKNFSLGTICNNLTHLDNSFANAEMLTGYPAKIIAANLFSGYFKNKGFISARKEFQYINDEFWDEHKKRLNYLISSLPTSLNKLLYSQFTGPDLKALMRTGDRNSMRFSIESRVPFADDVNLIEYVFGISSAYKVRNGQSKYLLRDSMKDMLPTEIAHRKDKLGFATPEKQWFQQLKDPLKEMVSSNQNDEYINWTELNKNWDAVFNRSVEVSTIRLWRFINFAVWRRVFNI